jgi:prepilin-type processing-associated H-X9-DG protein
MFGEVSGGYLGAGYGVSPPLAGWMVNGWASQGYTVMYGLCPDPGNPNCDFTTTSGIGNGGGYGNFGGWHNGTCQWAFADGSVRPLSISALNSNFLLLQQLAGFNDGLTINDLSL